MSVCLECGGTGYVTLDLSCRDDLMASTGVERCDYCDGKGACGFRFDTGTSGAAHDFLSRVANDVVEGER
jgi:hypothetical protein